jgi:ABC-2 type transport system permease protein
VKSLVTVRAIAWKDFSIWLRRPVAIVTTLIPTVMYVAVVYYISVDVATPPIAVVASHHSPAVQRFVSELRSDGGFRAEVVLPTAASHDLASLHVAAVVTVPASLWIVRRRAVAAGHSETPASAVTIKMNNLNVDIAKDLRRSLALTIRRYGETAGWHAPVAVAEHDSYASDISLAQYRLLPGMVLILMIAGVVNTGLATCQEFEARTFKELTLAPTPSWALVLGKILGGWLTTGLIAAFVWAIGLVTGLISPPLSDFPAAVLTSLMVGLAASCLGVAIGATVKQFQLVTSLSVMASIYLFFAAGGVSVFGFLPDFLQRLSRFDPLRYAIKALVGSVLLGSTTGLLGDVAVLAAFACAGLAVSTLVVRRAAVA